MALSAYTDWDALTAKSSASANSVSAEHDVHSAETTSGLLNYRRGSTKPDDVRLSDSPLSTPQRSPTFQVQEPQGTSTARASRRQSTLVSIAQRASQILAENLQPERPIGKPKGVFEGIKTIILASCEYSVESRDLNLL